MLMRKIGRREGWWEGLPRLSSPSHHSPRLHNFLIWEDWGRVIAGGRIWTRDHQIPDCKFSALPLGHARLSKPSKQKWHTIEHISSNYADQQSVGTIAAVFTVQMTKDRSKIERWPPYFDDFCIENSKVHSYNTRRSKQLHKTFNRTNYGKYSTREKIIKIWNEIPTTIKCSASLKVFKTKTKQFILQKWYWNRSYFCK